MPDDHPTLNKFLWGQYGNLFKFSLWWISLAPLTLGLLNSSLAIGVGRIVYNAAMCILSPMGAIVAERYAAKKILIYAALVRFVLWCVCLPLMWAGQASDWMNFTEIFVALCIMLFIDGCAVALSTILDVDVCGLDIVAGAYAIEVDEETRNSFNSRNEIFFSLSFIFFAPLMAWGGLLYRKQVQGWEPTWSPTVVASGTLTSVFVVTFFIATIWQVFFFIRMPNPPEAPPAESINDIEGPEELPSIGEKVSETLGELKAGLSIFRDYPPVLFRVLFLGVEIAVEDATIVVIAAQCGVKLHWMGNDDAVEGNIWTAMSVCVGKIGAAVASIVMLKTFKPPATRRGFWPLFALVALSSLISGGFPLTVYLEQEHYIDQNTARTLFLTTCLLFFFFSTMPKVGFMCLLQTMVSTIPNGHRAFGFIAIVATIVDGLIVITLTSFFESMSILSALIASFGVFMAHGILEITLGPTLVLRDGNGGGGVGSVGGSDLEESLVVDDNPANGFHSARSYDSSSGSMHTMQKPRSSSILTDD